MTGKTILFLPAPPVAGVRSIALLAGLEACIRGMLISTMPLEVYRTVGDAAVVSKLYFVVGLISMTAGLLVPGLSRRVARRWLYTGAAVLYMAGAALAVAGGPVMIPLALMANTLATAVILVCFNAYVLDFIARTELGRSLSTQMFYAAAAYTGGPVLGVMLLGLWRPLPFLVAGAFAVVLLGYFWWLRLGDGKAIQRARGPTPNPLAYLGRFVAQPRLVAGWLFAVVRASGWLVYVVYLPIYCIEAGLGDKLAGIMLSASNGLLFASPFIAGMARRIGLRRTVGWAFAIAGMGYVAAGFAMTPVQAIAFLAAGSVALAVLDVTGGLPFLMAVKPSQRTEMAAVYASYRDVSGLLTPGVAWLVLLAAPVAGVFAACGAGLLATGAVATRLHPRLGAGRPSRGGPPRARVQVSRAGGGR